MKTDKQAIQAQCTQCKRIHLTTIDDYEQYVGGWLCQSCRAERAGQRGTGRTWRKWGRK